MTKKKVTVLISLAVAAVLTIGGTFAYLKSTTQEVTNTFSSSKNAQIQLREAKWDGWTFSDAAHDGTVAKTDSTDLGINQAKAYEPGQSIAKDPTVKNAKADGTTNDLVSVYTAVKLQYYLNGALVSYNDFSTALLAENGIAFSSNWTSIKADDTNKYYVYEYNNILAPGNSTDALFSNVPISLNLDVDSDGQLPTFKIVIKAYAVQSDNTAADTAVTELNSMAAAN